MKTFLLELEGRFKRLVLKLISPSFLTWCLLFYVWQAGKIKITDTVFIGFTLVVILGKKYLERGQGNA